MINNNAEYERHHHQIIKTVKEYSKYSTGLCQDLIEIDRDRIDGQLITKHSDLRKVCA